MARGESGDAGVFREELLAFVHGELVVVIVPNGRSYRGSRPRVHVELHRERFGELGLPGVNPVDALAEVETFRDFDYRDALDSGMHESVDDFLHLLRLGRAVGGRALVYGGSVLPPVVADGGKEGFHGWVG